MSVMEDLRTAALDTEQRLPICEFHRLIPDAPAPQRADRSAVGTLPFAAVQYCEPVASASAFGWYFFPATTFWLWWMEGDEIAYSLDGDDVPVNDKRWSSLGQAACYPNYRDTFAAMAPSDMAELTPPMLAQGLLPGSVQVWSGWAVRTAPGWSLLSRRVANLQEPRPFENLEGILETDTAVMLGFTNIQLKRINSPVEFHVTKPLFQMQPLWRPSYRKPPFAVHEAVDWSESQWRELEPFLRRNANDKRDKGHYAAETRRRLRREEEVSP
jgi:hypothetical protein